MDDLKTEDLFDSGQSMQEPEDDRLFSDEQDPEEAEKKERSSKSTEAPNDFWKVLVVDDEEDIHSVTRMALKGFTYKNRGVEFMHAYSGRESEKVLRKHPDIAVILLDVVMESNTAGLNLVRFIRETLKNKFVQIILRTGYPGYAPEREVIVSYEINDYKTKTELTAFKLFTLILASLRAYDSITSLEQLRAGLEDRVRERTAELQDKNEKIMEMDRMKTRFFANISHEFRTPLTLILAPVEDILSKEELSEKKRRTMEMMYRNALRLLTLVNQLLDLARIDEGSMKLQLVTSDVFRFLRLVASSFHGLAQQKGVDYQVHIPEDELLDSYDQDKIEKIVTNLLSNAFKFTPGGGKVRLQVDHRVREGGTGHWIMISVEDTGPGIPEQLIEKVFDRFYRVEGFSAEETGGSGIGLSLTKELTQLHHGKIEIRSSEDSGTSFMIHIPLGVDHLEESEYVLIDPADFDNEALASHMVLMNAEAGPGEEHDDQDAEVEDKTAGKQLVLVVEDSADVRSHLRGMLESEFVVREAENGAAGWSQAVEVIPDLVITDLMMPVMDGVVLCQKLKTEEPTSHIPVIMLTAKASVKDRIQGLETGADAYLTKPFNKGELLAQVINLVEQRKTLRERFGREVKLEAKDISITSADEKFLNRTMEVIEEHMSDYQFDVNHLSGIIGLSRMQLFRKIKALTDQTPSEFIRTIRLKRAARLMEGKFGNVAEITYEVGFNNLSYFAKCFKEMFGMTPSEFVKSSRDD